MEDKLLERISVETSIMTGKPVIKGTRLTVEFVLNLLAHGASYEEILNEYNGLCQDDILACILFASKSMEHSAFLPLTMEHV